MSENGTVRRDIYRALDALPEVRASENGGLGTLVGHAAVFNEWTEIRSRIEGNFMERIAPGAFNKTIEESRGRMRVLFDHGEDPTFGTKPLGPIANLEPDSTGLRYEVPLLDTTYNRDLAEMLRADPPVLGSSFRFQVVQEDRVRRPGKSAHNPQGLEERTVREVKLKEFGPVTFPAYAGAGAGLRSLTDRMSDRADTEDLDTLAQMVCLASAYIEEQDEPGDEANIPRMEAVLATLVELQNYEVGEDEPEEPEENSAQEGGGRSDGAPTTDEAGGIPPSPRRPREPVPLYTGKEETPSWRL